MTTKLIDRIAETLVEYGIEKTVDAPTWARLISKIDFVIDDQARVDGQRCQARDHLYGDCTKPAGHVEAGDEWHRDGPGTCWRDYKPEDADELGNVDCPVCWPHSDDDCTCERCEGSGYIQVT